MKKIFYILTASFCLGMMGCQEDEALLFQDVARVQFTSGVEDYPYSFVWLDRSQDRTNCEGYTSGRIRCYL